MREVDLRAEFSPDSVRLFGVGRDVRRCVEPLVSKPLRLVGLRVRAYARKSADGGGIEPCGALDSPASQASRGV